METLVVEHGAFNQKPTYQARPSDWIAGGGHAHYGAACRFLDDLSEYRSRLVASHDVRLISHTWLLPFRDDFRRLTADYTLRVVLQFMHYGDRSLRHVGIWLLRHYADRFELLGIDDYSDDRSLQVRRHVAKALRRKEAWFLLQKMAVENPSDARIQWFANAPTSRRPFNERLRDFTQIVDASHAHEVVTPSRMPFWSLERAWERTPPKSVQLIRRILRRIKHWVRWGSNESIR